MPRRPTELLSALDERLSNSLTVAVPRARLMYRYGDRYRMTELQGTNRGRHKHSLRPDLHVPCHSPRIPPPSYKADHLSNSRIGFVPSQTEF